MAIVAAALLTAIVLILILAQPSRVIYIRLLSIPALCIAFILCLILLSNTAVKAALNGLNLWSGVVVPSLFPFFVSAEILNSTGFIRASGLLLEPVMRPFFNVPGCGSFALAMGVTSGYPVGAKITCDFRSKGDLTRTEAERLLAFTNNSGPLFIVGAVGTGMYGSSQIGLLLLACHFFACLTVGFLFRFYKADHKPAMRKTSHEKSRIKPFIAFRKKLLEGAGLSGASIGTIIGDSVKNSAGTILAIGGFIVLFSVVISLLSETGIIGAVSDLFAAVFTSIGLDRNVIRGILSGFFEITTGSNLVSSIIEIPLTVKLPAASFIIGWAGLSVHFQVLSIASKTDISIYPYLIGKMLQGAISAFYTWLFLRCFHFEMIVKEPVLGSSIPTPASWLKTFGASLLTLSVILCIYAFFLIIVRQHSSVNTTRLKRRH
jgi:sporulation integral membrane protein YlbJ